MGDADEQNVISLPRDKDLSPKSQDFKRDVIRVAKLLQKTYDDANRRIFILERNFRKGFISQNQLKDMHQVAKRIKWQNDLE